MSSKDFIQRVIVSDIRFGLEVVLSDIKLCSRKVVIYVSSYRSSTNCLLLQLYGRHFDKSIKMVKYYFDNIKLCPRTVTASTTYSCVVDRLMRMVHKTTPNLLINPKLTYRFVRG